MRLPQSTVHRSTEAVAVGHHPLLLASRSFKDVLNRRKAAWPTNPDLEQLTNYSLDGDWRSKNIGEDEGNRHSEKNPRIGNVNVDS